MNIDVKLCVLEHHVPYANTVREIHPLCEECRNRGKKENVRAALFYGNREYWTIKEIEPSLEPCYVCGRSQNFEVKEISNESHSRQSRKRQNKKTRGA